MALVDTEKITRREIPHEPGEWMDFRALSAGDMEGLEVEGARVTLSLDLAATSIAAWSYEAPISKETVRKLDLGTFTWATQEVLAISGIRSEPEKNASGASSLPTTERDAALGPGNSAT